VLKADGERRAAKGAPRQMEGGTDATWARGGEGTMDVTCLNITMKGAMVCLELKKSPLVDGGSSASLEGLGLAKLTDKVMYARIVGEKLGLDMSEPTTLLCDAEAALRAASGETSVVRLKHALRRSMIVRERVREGGVRLAHIPDATNVADIFTKWVSKEKFERLLAYLTGASALGPEGEAHAMVVLTMAAIAIVAEKW
jgi:hypothetical protein